MYKKTGTTAPANLKVLAIGDSITNGDGNNSKGYWDYLKQDLSANNITVAGEANTWKKGRTGYAIKEVNSGNASELGLTYTEYRSGIYESINGDFNDAPDVVLLMAGTNDIISNYRAGIITRLQSLIEKVHEKAPNAVIFVASIPDFNFSATSGKVVSENWFKYYDQNTGNVVVQYQQISYNEAFEKMINGFVKDYNTQIQSLVNTLSKSEGYKISFVDINSVVSKSTLEDGCHPNDDGNKAMATAYANAITSYYTAKEPVKDSNGNDLTVPLNAANNWRAAIDVPAGNDTYCVEEVNVPDGWDVTYENNAQQANSTTPILVKNQKQPTDINLTVEKTWAKDDASNRPSNISLTLLRSNGKKQDNSDAANTSEWFWEELRIPTPTPTTSGNRWTFAYTGLPASDAFGNAYHYKVQEAAVSGYTVSYGTGEENGVTAAAGETATLHVTNTRAITLQIEKQWSDGETNQHLQDAVRVRIYRSTNPSDVPTANLTLQVTPETVSVGVNGTATVTANKKITVKEIANDTIANATISEDGKTLTITGKEAGTTTITVTDGTMEKQIFVTVSVEPTLNLSISPASIRVGGTATLTPSMSDGSDCSGVTYSITAGTDVVSISGNTVTGSKVGTATIVAERNGKTSNPVTITVTELPLSLDKDNVTVSVGDTATIQANRTVTISQAPVDSIATAFVSGKNITVAGVAEGSTSFTVRDSDGQEKTVSVTVNPQQVANGKVLEGGKTYIFEIPPDKQENIKKLEVSFKDYPTNKSNDGVDVYFNAFNEIGSKPNSWIKFNDDGSMKDLYIFDDYENYFSKETRDGYTFGTVSGNTAIWEKTTASKNEKIIFEPKGTVKSCTITQIKITYKDGTSYTVTDFGGGDSGGGDTPSTPTQITLTANSTTLKVGGTLQLNSNVTGVTYSSSNAQVATVSADGVVTGVGAGSVTITATKDGCTAGTIDLTVTSDSSSGGGESGGGSGGSESGETRTVTIESGKETDVWFNDAHSDVAISSIMIDAKGISGDKQMRVRFRSNNADWAGDFYIKNYNNTLSKDAESNCNVSLSGTVFTIDSFKYNLNRITFTDSALSGDVAITINYATTPQSLSAPRRAVAAAAVIESEQLLSATNETAGVQTQALENTIDASEVSDSDWASGLLLEIDATDHWQGSVTNLSVTDSNGNTYYYWAVEEPVTGYTPSYLFQDADGSQSNAIKADAQVDGTDIIVLNTKQDTSYTLPSTGGTGVTRYYLIGLLLMGGSGLVVCYQFRRKRHGNCAK